ncbi:MAG: hypothetical protein IKQ04_05890 [Oscillospiraceae bacterium]|nr:hypothetical protein [Oscillospiraceae bacterium]MBR7010291.1 hypothetical protein [Oscillospiraceae bacterium]
MKEYWVLTGSFGSGKSELVLNLALEKAKKGPCTVVDLDVINPYFRVSERGDVLSPAGVELIMPPFALEKIEIMSLSARVYSAFAPGEGTVIFDIGGDDVGSIALGQYKPRFAQIPPDKVKVLFVVNPLRPTAADLESALDTLYKIQYVSRMDITGIVNNANLAGETELSHLLQGYELVKALSRETGIPVWGTCGTPEVLRSFEEYAKAHDLDPAYIGKYQPIEIMMHRSWDKFLKEGL